MAIKKTELYSSLWASCDALRGGMEPSQYKDYVLVMLFVKYISDKWAGQPYAPISIPEGASFKDMVAMKGKSDIGDQINKKILGPIAEANKLADMPDFNDVSKLGSGKAMVDTLTDLISIFENPALDFSKNKADGDDIMGDAYEYLMQLFASASGKSKGQFYTPAEVSRTMAAIIGIDKADTSADTTVYDPTCGSGSLLLRVGSEAHSSVTLYGQEMESTTAGLARMNMILHDNPTAEIKQGNTLADPLFLEDGNLKTFDYVIANPPFSTKRWGNGLNLPEDEPYNRFADYGTPPDKNGDYAFLLHIVRSLKRNGKGAIILPHGVLFRGNAEAGIRTNLVKKGYIKGIIGLPANLFYGTGIPAAIILIDKENANNRKGLFMIDAGKGFMKDGPKNRLCEQDIRKITDVFNAQKEIPGYSRMVSIAEIEDNEFNLNIPRYIDSQEKEDIQDIQAHLQGGIPIRDIDALNQFWEVFPNLRKSLFKQVNDSYAMLNVEAAAIRDHIFAYDEFVGFMDDMQNLFNTWRTINTEYLKALEIGHRPKEVIKKLSEELLELYSKKALIDKYDIFQHLMSYWNETMQDDCYIVSGDGWVAETYRIMVANKSKKLVDKGWTCDLIPKDLVINRYFADEKQSIADLETKKETLAAELVEIEEEQSGDDGFFADFEKVNAASIKNRLKEIKREENASMPMAAEKQATYGEQTPSEKEVLQSYLDKMEELKSINSKIKKAEQDLDKNLYAQYPNLSADEVKQLVVDDKWMQSIQSAISGEIDHISQRLTNRIKELAERYETPLPQLEGELSEAEAKVNAHLKKMGFAL